MFGLYWKKITAALVGIIAALLLFLGMTHSGPFSPSPTPDPSIVCLAVDPPDDEGPGLDYDSHNCPGVAYIFPSYSIKGN